VHVPSYRAIIVLKDLQDAALFCDYTTTLNRAQAESQVRLLAAMHARFYNDAANPKLRAVDTFANRFRRVSEYHGLEEACGRGYLASEAVMPRSVMRRYDKSWPLTLASVEILSRERSTLTHGDVHLGNWYMLPGNVMGLSDFQNMTLGHWVRDLAYTIVTSLNVEDRRSSEGDLIRLYMETLFGLVGGSESFDSTWRHYRQQMLSVLAWWTVTLTPAPTMAQNMQTPETSLCFIGRIGQAMEDLETFDAF
jgi:aminoglycoside phosphotransferase (APT) family kinase protein